MQQHIQIVPSLLSQDSIYNLAAAGTHSFNGHGTTAVSYTHLDVYKRQSYGRGRAMYLATLFGEDTLIEALKLFFGEMCIRDRLCICISTQAQSPLPYLAAL